MLQRLRISNYELIDQIDQRFHSGLNVITGETGTGKSMILSAIHLLSGGRGSDKVLKNKDEKCILEATFSCSKEVEAILNEQDLDGNSEVIIRREFLPQGRSRAFINDTPVNLDLIKQICRHLIDIHSQDQTNNINDPEYQLELLDIYALNQKESIEYQKCFSEYDALKSEISKRKVQVQKDKDAFDFLQYQFDELDKASLSEGEIAKLEEEKEILSKQEEIKNALESGAFTISDREESLLDQLNILKQRFATISGISSWLSDLSRRIEESYTELKDLVFEMESRMDDLEMDPSRLQDIDDRLSLYYSLENKFKVSGDTELLRLKNEFEERLEFMQTSDEDLAKMELALSELYVKLLDHGEKLSKTREKANSPFSKEIENRLKQLGISYPTIKFQLSKLEKPAALGLDEVKILFSSNKDQKERNIEDVASGGEKSRVMLAIKSIIGSKRKVNSMVFDEIDTGISGEVAIKTGELLSDIGRNNQVISITHLPQVASKGIHHFKVLKSLISKRTNVQMELLSKEDRVEELAEMLGGKNISESARKTAQELLR
jgi:DNA repair protein RecN (Recombination protein N)